MLRNRLGVAVTGHTFSITSWIYRPCYTRAQRYIHRRPFQEKKPYYVTTPIFYVNAGIWYPGLRYSVYFIDLSAVAPHLGHLYTLVITDIFKRWAALQGKKAILCTGTDEHGLKVGAHIRKTLSLGPQIWYRVQVQQAAARAGQDVRAFCEENSQSFYVRQDISLSAIYPKVK